MDNLYSLPEMLNLQLVIGAILGLIFTAVYDFIKTFKNSVKIRGRWFATWVPSIGDDYDWCEESVRIGIRRNRLTIESFDNTKELNWVGKGEFFLNKFLIGQWASKNETSPAEGTFILVLEQNGLYLYGFFVASDKEQRIAPFIISKHPKHFEKAKKILANIQRDSLPTELSFQLHLHEFLKCYLADKKHYILEHIKRNKPLGRSALAFDTEQQLLSAERTLISLFGLKPENLDIHIMGKTANDRNWEYKVLGRCPKTKRTPADKIMSEDSTASYALNLGEPVFYPRKDSSDASHYYWSENDKHNNGSIYVMPVIVKRSRKTDKYIISVKTYGNQFLCSSESDIDQQRTRFLLDEICGFMHANLIGFGANKP